MRRNPGKVVVFLTGVTGFLGGAFLDRLTESAIADEIVCLVRGDDQANSEERARRSLARFGRTRLPKSVRVLNGNLLSTDWHSSPLLQDVTHVLHLAASTSFGNHRGIRKTNVDGALAVAEAMSDKPLERYVHVGTATICGACPHHVVQEDEYPNASVNHLVPYTRSKAEAERMLGERYADLPIVVARPSIVVGHTSLGVKPSGSIFWVLRAVEALGFIAWNPAHQIDVIPVDWAAAALEHLLFAPNLEHKRYHVSAGRTRSVRWSELAAEYSRLDGGPSRNRYRVGKISELTRDAVRRIDSQCNPRHLQYAMELYYRFCSQDLVFDNSRLLGSGMPPPPRFTEYMRTCVETSPASIYEQMRVDVDPAVVLV